MKGWAKLKSVFFSGAISRGRLEVSSPKNTYNLFWTFEKLTVEIYRSGIFQNLNLHTDRHTVTFVQGCITDN